MMTPHNGMHMNRKQLQYTDFRERPTLSTDYVSVVRHYCGQYNTYTHTYRQPSTCTHTLSTGSFSCH